MNSTFIDYYWLIPIATQAPGAWMLRRGYWPQLSLSSWFGRSFSCNQGKAEKTGASVAVVQREGERGSRGPGGLGWSHGLCPPVRTWLLSACRWEAVGSWEQEILWFSFNFGMSTGVRYRLKCVYESRRGRSKRPMVKIHAGTWELVVSCPEREQWGDTQLNSSYCFKVETVGFSVTCEGKIQRGLQDFSSEQVKELSFRLHTWRKIWEKDICVEIRKWDFEHVKCAMPIGHLNENVT